MKIKLVCYLMLLVGLNTIAQTINVSTGIDAAGNALSIGSTYPTWQVVSGPNGLVPHDAFAVATYPFSWQATPIAGTNAQWIDYHASIPGNQFSYFGNPGTYVYERTFNIAAGTTSLTCNFGVAYDDTLLSLELVPPGGVAIPLTVVTSNQYSISNMIANVITAPTPGSWKIRATVNYFDVVGGFMLSGDVTLANSSTPTCNTSTSDFESLYTGLAANSSYVDHDYMDLQVHSYTFDVLDHKTICSVGYRSQPGMDNIPYEIKISDIVNGIVLYDGFHLFSSTATTYATLNTPVALHPARTYLIERIQTSTAFGAAGYIGRLVDTASGAPMTYLQSFGNIEIIDSDFYDVGMAGTNPYRAIPFIDIRFQSAGTVPSAPVAANQTFCLNAVVSNLVATGQNLQWYTVATNGTALASNTLLASGTYYVSQTVGSVESTRTAVVVTINTVSITTYPSFNITFLTGSPITTLTPSHSGGNPTTSYSVNPSLPTGLTLNPTTGSISGTPTVATPSTTYTITTQNACGIDTSTVTFSTIDPCVAPAISIQPVATSVCSGSSVTFSVMATGTGLTYQWRRDGAANIIVGANAATYTLTSAGFPDNRLYSCLVSNACGSAVSNFVQLTVNAPTSYYRDADNDTYGDSNVFLLACTQPTGYVLDRTDCDDTNAQINPNHVEVLGNGIDDNCDGTVDEVTPNSYLNICGNALASLWTTIFAYDLASYSQVVQGYRFEVTNQTTNVVNTYDATTNSFNLYNLPNPPTYATTYSVRVAVKIGGFWRAYGVSCTVTTPPFPTTSISSPTCGTTLTTIWDVIRCYPSSNATHYLFRVRLGATVIGTYTSTSPQFSIANIPGIAFGTTYTIDVVLEINGVWSSTSQYGPACSITTSNCQSSAVVSPTCGSTINNLWTIIRAQQVQGAQAYRFIITYGGNTITYSPTPPSSAFQLPQPGIGAANTTYTISVDVLCSNGSWIIGTQTCTIITSPTAHRSTTGFDILDVKAYPNPYTESFKLEINTTSEAPVGIKVYDMLGREIEEQQSDLSAITALEIGNRYPSGVYNIVVTQGADVKSVRVIKH